jgi:hypothetical protein
MTDGIFTAQVQRRRGKKVRPDPDLLAALLEIIPEFNVVVDYGCGRGELVAALCRSKRFAYGIDGSPGTETIDNCFRANLAQRMGFSNTSRWALTFEVGEHIPPEAEAIFVENVTRNRPLYIVVSWAVPGQRGRGHVNCRTPEYVASRFGTFGYLVDEPLTAQVRERAGGGWRKKLLVFRKKEET